VAGDAGKVRLMDGGLATSSTLCGPNGVAVDASGNIYIADTYNGRIRMVTKTTGIITTVAGGKASGYSGDGGLATSASLRFPNGVAVDESGNIYIADTNNNRIRMVTKTTGIITTVAGDGTRGYSGDGGLATSATLKNPYGVSVDASGNIYIADSGSDRIRLVTKTTGIITTAAGNGTYGYSGDGGLATSATLKNPYAVAVDASGNIYIADTYNYRIRMVTKTTGIITTAAGNGTYGYSGDGGLATSASLRFPNGVSVDASGNIYIADTNNNRIRMVTKTTGIITTVAGDDASGYSGDGGLATSATLNYPHAVSVDASGNIYIADSGSDRIRLATKTTGIITTLAGDDASGYSGDGGLATSATLNYPQAVAIDASGNIYIADTYNHRIRMVTKTTGIITTVAGDDASGYSGDGGLATSASLSFPYGVSVDASGNIYIADTYNGRIRMVTKTTGIITTVAGDGTYGYSGDGGLATSASLRFPYGVAVDASGNIYIADSGSNRILMVTKTTGIITTAAGNGTYGYSGDGGLATSATLNYPHAVAVDASGNIYISDSESHCIRLVTKTTGIITTVAGGKASGYSGDGGLATSASLSFPYGVSVDASGNIYIADSGSDRIRMVTKTTGIITTAAGDGTRGYSGDGGEARLCSFTEPTGIAIDASGSIYVTDRDNHRLRVLLLADVSTASPTNSPTVAPSSTLSPTPSPNTVSTPTPTPSPNTVSTPMPTPSPNTVSTPSPTPAPTRSPTLVSTPSSSNMVLLTSSSPGKCLCGDPSAFNVLACYATSV
jgi:trimeric autotransporter adhesin